MYLVRVLNAIDSESSETILWLILRAFQVLTVIKTSCSRSTVQSVLQSAEHWCQRRCSQIHLVIMFIYCSNLCFLCDGSVLFSNFLITCRVQCAENQIRESADSARTVKRHIQRCHRRAHWWCHTMRWHRLWGIDPAAISPHHCAIFWSRSFSVPVCSSFVPGC